MLRATENTLLEVGEMDEHYFTLGTRAILLLCSVIFVPLNTKKKASTCTHYSVKQVLIQHFFPRSFIPPHKRELCACLCVCLGFFFWLRGRSLPLCATAIEARCRFSPAPRRYGGYEHTSMHKTQRKQIGDAVRMKSHTGRNPADSGLVNHICLYSKQFNIRMRGR